MINEALILKLSWDLIAKDSQWASLFKSRYFSNGQSCTRYFKSSVWSGIKEHIGIVLLNSLWIVGIEDRIHFWTDNWLGATLVDLMNLYVAFHRHLKGMFLEAIANGGFILPTALTDLGDIKDRVDNIALPHSPLPDVLVWKHSSDGTLSSKHAHSFLCPQAATMPWAEYIWNVAVPPSHSFIFWRLHHGKMPTDENLRHRGCIVVSVWSLCLISDESSDHLFLRCQFATRLWDWIGQKLNCAIDTTSVDTLLSCRPARYSSQVSDIFLAAVLHTTHTIWWARNSLRFSVVIPTLHSAKIRIHSFIAMSGNISKGKCLQSDFDFLDTFAVSHHC